VGTNSSVASAIFEVRVRAAADDDGGSSRVDVKGVLDSRRRADVEVER